MDVTSVVAVPSVSGEYKNSDFIKHLRTFTAILESCGTLEQAFSAFIAGYGINEWWIRHRIAKALEAAKEQSGASMTPDSGRFLRERFWNSTTFIPELREFLNPAIADVIFDLERLPDVEMSFGEVILTCTSFFQSVNRKWNILNQRELSNEEFKQLGIFVFMLFDQYGRSDDDAPLPPTNAELRPMEANRHYQELKQHIIKKAKEPRLPAVPLPVPDSAPKNKKGGRPRVSIAEDTRRRALIGNWQKAKLAKVPMKQFCDEGGVTLKYLETCIAWDSTRNRRRHGR